MKNWLTTGWEMLHFIITPEELSRCLADFHLVVHNAHVPVDYVESSVDSYIDTQKRLFERLASGDKILWKEDYTLFQITGLTTDLSLCGYGNTHEYNGELFMRPAFVEPCIHLAPFTFNVMRDNNGNLSISKRVSYTQHPENTVGIEVSYPKRIQFKSSANGNYGMLQSTKELHSYQDFILFKEIIKRITRPLSFQMAGKTRNPGVRISEDALRYVPKFYFFQSNSIQKICEK